METKRLFDENVMQRECEAVVVRTEPYHEGYAVVLDQTVFFPEGGGQLSDTGTLTAGEKALPVKHVHEKAGEIFHETKEPLAPGTKVVAKIDWPVRFNHMQQHCGEHMLSYAFYKLFGAHNVGFHMSADMVGIDLDREVDWQQALQAERFTNREIQEDRPVTTKLVPAEEAAKMNLRKFNDKLTGILRIVTVEGSDSCTCCGTHPTSSGMVGLVKIFKVEKHKEGSRISFLCGREALERVEQYMLAALDASNLLSIKETELPDGIARLQQEKKELGERLTECTGKLLEYRIEEMKAHSATTEAGHAKFVFLESDMTPKEAKALAKRLGEIPEAFSAIFYQNGERLNYMFLATDGAAVNCQQVIRTVNEAFGGRGGGRPESCQGSAICPADWREKAEKLLSAL
ncbi:alanine--tRNA ligase-related protein [uncultured Mitsuokella sp.]|uniref:alanyl-tRNA editing protein n=1 Tax=uncultured Mitsuokella sp. TaxID=453120 RepID=UPI002674FB79|nr:alanine--tRNA ligase-related protein [uncultured Mitsuokella sp.]